MKSCSDCLVASVAIIEELYPEWSIERAHEYHKLSEVLCNNQQYSRALKFARKARSIFERQYTSSHELSIEVDELCRRLEIVCV